MSKVNFKIDEKVWNAFTTYCRERRYIKSAVLRRLVKEWLRKEGYLD